MSIFARMEQPKARNSRWDRAPKLDGAGKQVVARLTDDDIAIFRILGRYRYLPSDYIAALAGRYPIESLEHVLPQVAELPGAG